MKICILILVMCLLRCNSEKKENRERKNIRFLPLNNMAVKERTHHPYCCIKTIVLHSTLYKVETSKPIQETPETLNIHFSTTAQRLLNSTPKSEEILNELIENLPCNQNTFSISKTSFAEIRKAICGLRNDCSTVPDKIPVKYLKLGVDEITSPLCHIINESLECQMFPSERNLSKISPFRKSATPSNQATTDLSPSCQSFRRFTKRLL